MKSDSMTFYIALTFVLSLLGYYIFTVCKAKCLPVKKIETIASILLVDYLPLLVAIVLYFFLLSQRGRIIGQLVYTKASYGSREDHDVIYNSYAFMAGSAALIGLSVFLYMLSTFTHQAKNIGSNTTWNKIFLLLCVGTLILNLWFVVHVIDLIILKQELTYAYENLKNFEFVSTVSITTFFLIDFVLLQSLKCIPNRTKDVTLFMKSVRFSIWNVDISSLLALSFILYLDKAFLHYEDNYLNYVFVTSGIALQAVLTQFIFSSYQAKHTISKLLFSSKEEKEPDQVIPAV